jgi:hypothetical protein
MRDDFRGMRMDAKKLECCCRPKINHLTLIVPIQN